MERLEDIKDYWSLRADGYSCSILDDLKTGGSGKWLATIKGFVGNGEHLKVLDIGTGPGFFPILMGREGHEVTAVDYTEAMLEKARMNCRDFGVTAEFRRMDAQVLSFPDDSFDLILSRNLLWDLERPRQAYREWLRVLRPGGRIIVFDGNHYLHLYDDEYASAEKEKKQDDHRYLNGVDTNVMKEIARELPLSKERRPQWDVNTLIELGARSVTAEVGDDVHHGTVNGEAISLPRSFIICARK